MKSDQDKTGKLTIGRLAEAAGVSVETIRYYQRRDLLAQPEKPQYGGFRIYSEADLTRLLLIRRAQEFGFTLAEIADLLAHIDAQNRVAIKALAKGKLRAIRARISDLEKVWDSLAALANNCPDDCPENCLGACPLIDRLYDTTAWTQPGLAS